MKPEASTQQHTSFPPMKHVAPHFCIIVESIRKRPDHGFLQSSYYCSRSPNTFSCIAIPPNNKRAKRLASFIDRLAAVGTYPFSVCISLRNSQQACLCKHQIPPKASFMRHLDLNGFRLEQAPTCQFCSFALYTKHCITLESTR